MFLKRLEIFGFKSFADRIELQFAPGITAIVGPNGSGKSNVGDAVRWVLGEQSAKMLRGARMEDVIFGGTETRKKLSFCEVVLTFDNADRSLPIDYAEVEITRRLYRSGDSEYYINKGICRLKDVVELFQDTGIGKEGYSIIGQGKIDNILSNKSEERRAVFEEAAGIVKYKTRKQEAERKLEHTCANLARIDDIITELQDRLEPLSAQADTAKVYLAIREELKKLEVNFYLYQYDIAAQKKAGINANLEDIEGEYQVKDELKTSLGSGIEASQGQLAEFERHLDEIREQILELTRRMEEGKGESRLYNERVTNIETENNRIQAELSGSQDRIAALMASLEGDQVTAQEKHDQTEQLKSEVEQDSAVLTRMDSELEAEGEELEKAKAEIVSTLNRLSDVKANLSRYEAMKANITSRNNTIGEQLCTILHERRSIQEAVAAQQEASGEIEVKKNELLNKKEIQRNLWQKQHLLISDTQTRINEEIAQLQNAQSRLNMLEEMKKDYEGFSYSVKQILSHCDTDPIMKKKVCGVIAQLASVPQKYERAVETALGAALQNIVTPTQEDAKELIEYLKQGKYGRATFLPLSEISGKTLNQTEKNTLRVKGCYGAASDLIEYDPIYKGIFENLLGRTVLCDNLDIAITIAQQNRQSFRLVSLDGDVINAGGSMTGGSSQSKLTSILGREREIEETKRKAASLGEIVEKDKQAIVQARAERTAIEGNISQLENEIHQFEVLLARDAERMHKLTADLAQNEENEAQLKLEAEQLTETMAEIEQNITGIYSMQNNMQQFNTDVQEGITKRQAEYNNKRLTRERLLETLNNKKIRLAENEKDLSAMQGNAERIRTEMERIGLRKAERIEKINKNNELIAQINSESLNFARQIELVSTALYEKTEKQKELASKRDTLNEEIIDKDRQIRKLEQDTLDAQERRHKLELALQKIDSDIALLEQRVWDEYELTYANAAQLRDENFKVTGTQTEINRRRKEINELGNVNVNAIEEYIATKERFESLSVQRDDLTKAEKDLRKIIEDMVKKMEVQFREQFAIINKYFGMTFKELFGGGKAELRLENSEDILGSGIEIVAQPPGKALQMLSLLSGGERALTAIAILFAMLKLKPTPFCILDEIEAALDEANVYNFASYLRSYADKTQFVVVTHRKPTMEEADSLYGVAMEEKGISKMVSVRLVQAS